MAWSAAKHPRNPRNGQFVSKRRRAAGAIGGGLVGTNAASLAAISAGGIGAAPIAIVAGGAYGGSVGYRYVMGKRGKAAWRVGRRRR